jgi:serine/threonine-protein kinase
MALAVFLGIVAVAGWTRAAVQSPGRVVRFEFETLDSNGIPLVMDVSPDGSRILIVERAGGRIRLFARELGSLATARLQASDRGPGWPFFSPDGTEFGFTSVSIANELIGTLRTAAIAGGPARTLVDSVLAQAGWGDDGFIYYARASRAGHSVLARIASTGGRPDTLVHSDSISFVQPHPLPGSRGLLMIAKGADGTTRLSAMDLRTRKWRPLVASGYFVAYDASGYVLFDQGQSLMAAPFDARRMELTAPPVPVAQVASGAFGAFAMAGGTLTYLSTASGGLENVPLLTDRKGRKRRLESLPPGQFYGFPAASPDGRRIALRVEDAAAGRSQPDIWVYQLPAGPLTRLTFDGSNDDASWTPDGTRVLFQSNRGGTNALWLEPWDGTGEAEKVLDRGKEVWRTSWLPDGRRFLFDEQRGEGTTDLSSGTADVGIAILGQPDSARLLLTGQFDETWPAASPDGSWLAYQSNESGRDEIYVRPLDRLGMRRQLSRSGGRMPIWARSGRELFFVSSSADSLAAVRLDTSKDAEVLGERMLFPLRHASNGYDVLPGDSLFVLVEPKEDDRERASVVVVSNFATELRARMAPAGKGP